MEAKQVIRPLVSVLIVGSSLCFLYNVMADDTDLRKLASRTACGEDEVIDPWRVGRYPVWQTYGFRCASGSVDVTCTRFLYLFGEYSCTWDAGNPPPSGGQGADRVGPAIPNANPPRPRPSASGR